MRTLSTTHTTRHVEVKWRKGKSCFSRNTDEQGIPEEAEKTNLLIITWGRKVNCVMRCFSFKLIGRGSASAKGGCTSTPDERKITTT